MTAPSDYIDLCMAAKLFPGDPSASCIWRWCRKGCKSRSGRRVYLSHQRVGGKLYITREWAAQFLDDLASEDQKHFASLAGDAAGPGGSSTAPTASPSGFQIPPRQRTAAQREADISRAEAIVKSWGRSKRRK
jgi:hypothetical protein